MGNKLTLAYSDLKDMVTAKSLAWQFNEDDKKYYVFAVDGEVLYQSEIWKSGKEPRGINSVQNEQDILDFEQKYKALANKTLKPTTSEGLPKVLAAVSPDEVSLFITGRSLEVSENTFELDSSFDSDIQLQGMVVQVKDADWGDSIDVEVGYLSEGTWVCLKEFGKYVPMRDGAGWQVYEYRNNAVSKITTNLKIRVRYNQASSSTTKKLIVHYITHK